MLARTRSLAVLSLLLVTTGAAGAAAKGSAVAHYNVGKDRLALQGYCPVSYFQGHTRKGDAKLTAEREGVLYRFHSEEHRKQFLAEPNKFTPAYGGWCATAMAEGKKVEIDPRNFKVSGGRLFLFYKSLLHDAQKDWNKDEPGHRDRADKAWKGISGE
jgi:YHS domain-containing protein